MVLKAVILVGGYGTRLRPFTFKKPKPLVEFCNKPIVLHQIEALVAVGVKEIILCVNVEPKQLKDALSFYEKKLGITITMSLEEVPMGTAGPLTLCADRLNPRDPDPFFMLNADVTCCYPFQELLDFHKKHGKEGTILVTKVEDPSKYGVVCAKENGQIERFVEKPKKFVGDKINAGMYIFNKDILKRIPNQPCSIEREIFPRMAADENLYRMVLPGFWMDIGQPKDYLSGQVMKLEEMSQKGLLPEISKEILNKNSVKRNNYISPTVKMGHGCFIAGDVVIGDNVVIGNFVRLERCAIFSDTCIADGANVKDSIVGWNNRIGTWARLQENCFLGEDVKIPSNRFVRDIYVCPHKSVKEDNFESKIILGL